MYLEPLFVTGHNHFSTLAYQPVPAIQGFCWYCLEFSNLITCILKEIVISKCTAISEELQCIEVNKLKCYLWKTHP